MRQRLMSKSQDAACATVSRIAPYAAVATTVVSLYVVSLNDPNARHVVVAAVILTCSVLNLALTRFRWASVLLPSLGGCLAVAVTSREVFSFWPAATALLVTAALAESTHATHLLATHRPAHLEGSHLPAWPRPVAATIGGAVGWVAAALGPDKQFAAPALPIMVAVGLVPLLHLTARWEERTRNLEEQSARYQRRAETSEAVAFELEHRTSLARELHDSLGHHLTAMVVQAEAGRVGQPDAALKKISDLGREALNELEAVLFDLRGHSPEPTSEPTLGLGAIDTKLARPLREHGVDVNVEINTNETDPRFTMAIYRIVQEALTNALRHSSASNVKVHIEDQDNALVVNVQDDGIGLAAQTPYGNGLSGIHERATQLGGAATFLASDPHGTTVRVHFPRTKR